jgi:hypothetical protein
MRREVCGAAHERSSDAGAKESQQRRCGFTAPSNCGHMTRAGCTRNTGDAPVSPMPKQEFSED